jgi:hypothetical protein
MEYRSYISGGAWKAPQVRRAAHLSALSVSQRDDGSRFNWMPSKELINIHPGQDTQGFSLGFTPKITSPSLKLE